MKKLARAALARLPRTRWGDWAFHLVRFIVAHRRLPARNSVLFNDYLFRLKVSGALDDALRQFTSDKEFVKTWVAHRLGPSYCARTLRVITSPGELSADGLPANSVIKPTHLSGQVVFVEESGTIGAQSLEDLEKTWDINLYSVSRERNYRNLRPKIICEEMIRHPDQMIDYKVFCYAGEPKLIQVDVGRFFDHRRSVYTPEWELLDVTLNFPRAGDVPTPPRLQEILAAARVLAADFESVRVDFYAGTDFLLVGELTHCPEQGHGRFGSVEEEQLFSCIYFF